MNIKAYIVNIIILCIIGVSLFSSCKKNTDPEPPLTKTMTDTRDNKVYEIVTIGEQTWLAENLNYDTIDSWWYSNSGEYGATYGRLYEWNAAMSACPPKWHLASDSEWIQLEMFMGMSKEQADIEDWRGIDEGKKLKSTSGWYDRGNGTDEVGFNVLAAGMRLFSGKSQEKGFMSRFWTSSDTTNQNAFARMFYYSTDSIRRSSSNRFDIGMSVRCIKD